MPQPWNPRSPWLSRGLMLTCSGQSARLWTESTTDPLAVRDWSLLSTDVLATWCTHVYVTVALFKTIGLDGQGSRGADAFHFKKYRRPSLPLLLRGIDRLLDPLRTHRVLVPMRDP